MDKLAGRTWMLMFAVTGCKHCAQMKPMWDEMARQLAASGDDVFVGRVNSTKHNGLARTMRVNRFPTVLLVEPAGGGEAQCVITVEGMTCTACVGAVERGLLDATAFAIDTLRPTNNP